MTKYEEFLELLDDYESALDLKERAVHGWTNKSEKEINEIFIDAKAKLHQFAMDNLK